MSKINLLPWRDELREQRKRNFVLISIMVAVLGVFAVFSAWMYFDQKLSGQEDANQLITSSNQELDQKLKSLEGLQKQTQAIVERMKLIQNLQAQRPITVRLVDQLVRTIPNTMYLTKFERVGDHFTIEGKAESPNVVADFMRNLGGSVWFRNVFMKSFDAADSKTNQQAQTSVVPRVEEGYGRFVVTADLGQIAQTAEDEMASEPQTTKGAAKK
ncbi:PilN domain-containing protein [Acinetobacter sp. MB5]|uniref:PilN domain-containing protein n=1 Tax=Acinetobacter sp. MB5 TaxID=2069438 RepID=UPI000DCFE224|nr:PilN domain-containing protein [Acinetobacter sp. MB5]